VPTHPSLPGPTSGGDLGRLLGTEARLEELLRRSREEAARLVAEARETARAREAALGEELEAAVRRLSEEIAAERQRCEQELVEEARREAERFDGVPADRIAELARGVVEQVIGSGG